MGMLCINTDQSAWEEFLAETQALQRYFPLAANGQINKWMAWVNGSSRLWLPRRDDSPIISTPRNA